MTAESLAANRNESTAPSTELSMIEFYPEPVARATSTTSANSSQSWLEGQSSAIERLRATANHAAVSGQGVVVVHGEPGSGRLRVAQWIHSRGRRSERPLMILDASTGDLAGPLRGAHRALTEGVGVVPGNLVVRNLSSASPTVIQRLLELITIQGPTLRTGMILLADDDIQSLRARSLQHGQLLGRAAEFVLHTPPLRSRAGDIGILARTFLDRSALRFKRKVRGLSPQALSRLEGHTFPGNIRELQFLIEQAVLRSSGDWVTAECFPGVGEPRPRDAVDAAEIVIRMPGSSLREIELQALRLALRLAGGRIVRASELLGITRHALRRKLEKYGLNGLRSRADRDDATVEVPVSPHETHI